MSTNEPVRSKPQGREEIAHRVTLDRNFEQRKAVVIGRGSECDIVVKDAKASRQHCRLTRHEPGFILEDLGSKNGTYFQGERIQGPVILKSDQSFKVGDTVFYLSP